MKIGGLIITYNPSLITLEENIKAAKKQVDTCLIVDNGSNNVDELNSVSLRYDITTVKLHKNVGIAGAQNEGFKYFKLHGFDWVLTLDQDSVIPEDTISEYLRSNKLSDNNTGIVTAKYYDRNWTSVQREALVYAGEQSVIEKKLVISSGNLVRVSAWDKVGGFDEFLFIDMVDYDFDAKLILAGYKIWQANSVTMAHAVGEVIHKPILEKFLLLPESGILADHPVFRQYYIYRNSIIFEKRFPMFGKKKLLILRSFFATRRMLVYENSFSKFKASWQGVVDGIKYNPNKDDQFLRTIKKIK